MDQLISELTAIVGPSNILMGDDVAARPLRWGEQAPHAAFALVRPASTQDVSQILKACNAAKCNVITLGGGTGLVGGTVTTSQDILLSLERMNKIEDLDETGRTITVQAGVTMQMVQGAALDAGLLYPVDLGARGTATIGGNICTNAGGNGVIRYGMTRDSILGLEVVLPDGRIMKAMNSLIKNNTGYDLKQLFIGSEGTLGVVTKAVLKLRPAPASFNTAFVAVDDFAAVTQLLNSADKKLAGTLSAFEVMWDNFFNHMKLDTHLKLPTFEQDHPYYVLIEASGGNPEHDTIRFEAILSELLEDGCVADAMIAQSDSDRANMWALRDNIPHLYSLAPLAMFDISVPLKHMEEYIATIQSALKTALGDTSILIFGHLGDGNIHITVSYTAGDTAATDAIHQIVYSNLSPFGGSVSAEHGIGLDKRDYLSLSRTAIEIEMMRQIKQVFDANNIMNPGKIFE